MVEERKQVGLWHRVISLRGFDLEGKEEEKRKTINCETYIKNYQGVTINPKLQSHLLGSTRSFSSGRVSALSPRHTLASLFSLCIISSSSPLVRPVGLVPVRSVSHQSSSYSSGELLLSAPPRCSKLTVGASVRVNGCVSGLAPAPYLR